MNTSAGAATTVRFSKPREREHQNWNYISAILASESIFFCAQVFWQKVGHCVYWNYKNAKTLPTVCLAENTKWISIFENPCIQQTCLMSIWKYLEWYFHHWFQHLFKRWQNFGGDNKFAWQWKSAYEFKLLCWFGFPIQGQTINWCTC